MPIIFRAPEVEDYITSYDLSGAARHDRPTLDAILRDYEDGKCVVLQGLGLKFDSAFFAGLQLANNRTAKKLKSRADAAGEIDMRALRKSLDQCTQDPRAVTTFAVQADRIARQVMPVMESIFPYAFYERRVTWRMLETIHEDLHLDAYAEDRSEQAARMFVNLDTVPRIWHTSHRLDHLLDLYGDRLSDVELADFSPGRIVSSLSERVYGGVPNAGRDGQPRHTIFFQPGDIWLVDSRKVSHQIFYGRRAISVDLFAPASTMLDPDKHYFAQVEAYRARRINS